MAGQYAARLGVILGLDMSEFSANINKAIDENKKLSKRLGIDEITFFKLYRNGKEIGNYIGELDRATFIRLLEGE
jgi:hypothetical protein